MKILQNNFIRRALLILALALLLMWTPVWNGFPFLHADSGTYIWSSVIFLVPQDRPIGYSLFLRVTQLVPSLWAVVIVQALGTAYLLWRVAERIMKFTVARDATRAWLAFGIVALTIALTTLSTFVGFILADILASWIFLGTVLLFVSARNFDRVCAALAILAGVWSHNSHVALALGLAIPLALLFFFARKTTRNFSPRAVLWFSVLLLALASMFAVNLYLRARAGVTRGGDTIWLNRFAESGVLQETLAVNCATRAWTMCAAAETLRAHEGEPRWFLFGADSPVNQVGWEKGQAEQREIVLRAFSCCAQKIFSSSARETWRQFWLLDMQGYLAPLDESLNAVYAVQKNFPREVDALRASRQQTSQFTPTRLVPFDPVTMQIIFLLVAFGCAVYAAVRRAWRAFFFLGGALYFIVLNAAVMATFSGAVSRYQARAAWLLVYAVLVVVMARVYSWIAKRRG